MDYLLLSHSRVWWYVHLSVLQLWFTYYIPQAAYTYRSIWSVGFTIIGVLWPYCAWPSLTLSQNWKLALQWTLSCLITSVFPLLPVDKKESLPTM